mmetsp:Transcript_93806/g.181006  ORF Transcript_93806/g.181006 Transcript_93806/m.181006 type:complete len:237 (+) Transcript_93806:1722-2432(+)
MSPSSIMHSLGLSQYCPEDSCCEMSSSSAEGAGGVAAIGGAVTTTWKVETGSPEATSNASSCFLAVLACAWALTLCTSCIARCKRARQPDSVAVSNSRTTGNLAAAALRICVLHPAFSAATNAVRKTAARLPSSSASSRCLFARNLLAMRRCRGEWHADKVIRTRCGTFLAAERKPETLSRMDIQPGGPSSRPRNVWTSSRLTSSNTTMTEPTWSMSICSLSMARLLVTMVISEMM